MIHFIANHWVVAIGVVVVLVLASAVCMCRAAGTHDLPVPIEPGDLGELPTTADVAMELKRRGFSVAAWDNYGVAWMQITDADAITFYMPRSATLEECLNRYQQKQLQFKAA